MSTNVNKNDDDLWILPSDFSWLIPWTAISVGFYALLDTKEFTFMTGLSVLILALCGYYFWHDWYAQYKIDKERRHKAGQ